MVVRYTTCLRQTGQGWTVIHEHASVPFDPETGLAAAQRRPASRGRVAAARRGAGGLTPGWATSCGPG